jgi:methylenetetrahydrofolate reductase (NADPH)
MNTMNFQSKLSNGDFVLLAEMSAPKGVDIFDLTADLKHLKSRVDAVVVPDMDNGVMHLSALGTGSIIRQQGIEPMIHVCGRDRNRMALQGDVLAAHVLGISNIVTVKGEEMASGDHPDAKPVDDLDEQQILLMLQSLASGVDMAGFDLKGKPDFFAGYQVQPVADDEALKAELESAQSSVKAGAKFVIVPPVYDTASYHDLLKSYSALGVPVIATVSMLKSVGMARYISINDPGARLPETLIARIRKAQDRELECVRIAGEMIREIKPHVQGIKISTSGWESRIPEILDAAGA